jgi:hypothetical protein
MGGLIWLEVLRRHPEWWPRIECLTLIASPIGGAHMGRFIDPLGLGIGIARDLGVDRRKLAEAVAAVIPTMAIAGDTGARDDSLVKLEDARMRCHRFVVLFGIDHPSLRLDPLVVALIRDFWDSAPEFAPAPATPVDELVRRLRAVPGMTGAGVRDFRRSKVLMLFRDGLSIHTWKNPLGIDHIFIADSEEHCRYAGYVGWLHSEHLRRELAQMAHDYDDLLLHADRPPPTEPPPTRQKLMRRF